MEVSGDRLKALCEISHKRVSKYRFLAEKNATNTN